TECVLTYHYVIIREVCLVILALVLLVVDQSINAVEDFFLGSLHSLHTRTIAFLTDTMRIVTPTEIIGLQVKKFSEYRLLEEVPGVKLEVLPEGEIFIEPLIPGQEGFFPMYWPGRRPDYVLPQESAKVTFL